MSDLILHTTFRSAWSAALESGEYAAASLAAEGFIHCSKPSQILRAAETFFTGQHGLVLLIINPALLASELRWEPGADLATDLFPHVYGPINLDAVVDVLEFEPGPDGKFRIPESLKSFNP